MIGLGIDTSTKVGALALVRDEELLIEDRIDAELDHSARLLPTLESALKRASLSRADLDCVGVGTGPGSLTGVRVGIAFAKGLVFALGKPLIGVCSLEAIAYRPAKAGAEVVSVIVDAKLGGYYHVAYRWTGQGIQEASPLCVCTIEDVPLRVLNGSLIVSPDESGLPGKLTDRLPAGYKVEPNPIFPSAAHIARRAMAEVENGTFDPGKMVEPIYLRPGVPRKAKSG
jgi:tRNA threonylcarbamoyladenosine biosynthesis protein TsaB